MDFSVKHTEPVWSVPQKVETTPRDFTGCSQNSGHHTSSLRCIQVWTGDKILDRLYHNMLTGTENWNQIQSWFVLPSYLGFKETTDVRKEYPSLLQDQTVRNMGHFWGQAGHLHHLHWRFLSSLLQLIAQQFKQCISWSDKSYLPHKLSLAFPPPTPSYVILILLSFGFLYYRSYCSVVLMLTACGRDLVNPMHFSSSHPV